MNIKNSIIVALRALQRNKLRTALTSLGIIIGVLCFIVMVGLGNSARVAVKEKIFSYGTNAISLMSFKKPFSANDIENLKKYIPEIEYTTPMNYFEFTVKYKNKSTSNQVFGVSNEYFEMNHWGLEDGSYFSKKEIMAYDRVVIIGSSIKEKLFYNNDPIGKIIQINQIPFRVIGCLEAKGTALAGRDLDSMIVGPYSTLAVKLFGVKKFYNIYVSTYTEDQIDDAKEKIITYLRRKHNLPKGPLTDFRISTSKDMKKMAEQVTGILTIIFAVVASVSLIVGGIGIMNIMLVSVSERTREIGIRMAIGAKSRDILMQFLVESVILCLIGGITGIILGITIYFSFAKISNKPYIFSSGSVILSFVFATLVGIVFGYYPAKKASRLNPIDALRHE